MTPRRYRFAVPALVAVLGAGLAVSGCGGGGGDGGGADGRLIGVSFIGFVTQPAGTGPNAMVPLPQVFIDQTLEFQFDGPIDAGIFGGFVTDQNGDPIEFIGVAPSATAGGIPYHAYANQGLAANALQIRQNMQAGPLLPSYVVGRHRDKPDTIVMDPRVEANNPLGLAFNGGFAANTEYTYRIPPNSGLTVGGGNPAQPLGVDPLQLPITLNPFGPQPSLSPVFRSSGATGHDPIPPEVLSIEASSGAQGTSGDPIPATDSIRITFSKPIDPTSLDLLNNLIVRNQDITTTQEPEGRLVPGNLVINPAQAQIVVFTPIPSFGPGVSMTQGFSIQVRVGTFGNPNVPNILGLPQGSPPEQLALANSLSRVFTTEPCPTCEASVAVVEPFADNDQEDGSFSPQLDRSPWNSQTTPGALTGTAISGNPLASFNGTPQALGTRTQAVMPIGPGTSLPFTTNPAGLFSPFDDNMGNNLMGVNPNGGSHSMWLVEAVDVGSPRASLELIEWHPVNDTVFQTTYPQYRCWAGMTTLTAPVSCPGGTAGGLTTIYRQNYDLVPPQPVDPGNTNPSMPNAGGVLVTPASAYQAGPGFTMFFPFPTFTPPFDYLGSGAGSGSLIYEINIEPGNQVANFNVYRATAVTPVRRIIGAPLSSGMNTAAGSGCDTYHTRFTFVSIVSSNRSLFYDTGVNMGTPRYDGITFSPSPQNQPAGTNALWEFEGATAISSPSTPVGVTSGFLAYWSGTPSNGTFNNLVLQDPMNPMAPQLTGNRFFRFRVTLRNDNVNNGSQQYNSILAAVAISGT